HVMWNISIWSKDHPDAYKWIEANGQWFYDNLDHCEVETSDDDDDARSLWSSDEDEHFDPFEDDPTHPDARWSLHKTNQFNHKNSQTIDRIYTKQTNQRIRPNLQFDSHQLPSSQVEHLVSLSLASDLPRHCLAKGYTQIHFGAIRLALTFHGKKGLPAYYRIALLDTRFLEYQHAYIGTIQTTLNAGIIFVTFYPNFNMPLNDPSLLTALKAQIQISGTPQVNTFQATFHYQMAYRVQNHSLDILVPGQDNAGYALLIDVDSNATPTCTYVPRQLSRDELVNLLPEKWITNYEQIHQASVRSTLALEFVRHENGLVEIKFSSSQSKSDNIFPIGIHMNTPTDQEPTQEVRHVWWDVCNYESCLDEAAKIDDDDEDLLKKQKSSQKKLKRRYEKDKNPTTIGPTGHAITISPAEATLNWQSENDVAQNKVLVKILSQQSMITNSQEYLSSRVRSLESIINELRFKIQELHREIIQIIRTSPTTQHFSFISQKEATSLIDDPWRLPSTPFVGISFDPQPLPQSYTHTTSPSLNIWASEQRKLKPPTRKEPTQESQSIVDVVTSTKTHDILPIQTVNLVSMFLNSLTQTDKPKNSQFISPVIKPQMNYEEFNNAESFEYVFMAELENAESTVQFDAEDYKENQENPNQETPTGFPKSDIKQYFTFDDVPPSKWRERCIEMLTWCTTELQYYTIDVVIKRFLTRLQGRLRDWYHTLGKYRQLQIQQSISPEAFMSIIYSEFIGSPWEHTAHATEEFLKMNCCSFQKKDLEKHYDRMS
nr:putative zinc finger, CCHC-type [Tanacetum cinerariifolium]